MFLDPYGMTVEWRTLEAIRATEAIGMVSRISCWVIPTSNEEMRKTLTSQNVRRLGG